VPLLRQDRHPRPAPFPPRCLARARHPLSHMHSLRRASLPPARTQDAPTGAWSCSSSQTRTTTAQTRVSVVRPSAPVSRPRPAMRHSGRAVQVQSVCVCVGGKQCGGQRSASERCAGRCRNTRMMPRTFSSVDDFAETEPSCDCVAQPPCPCAATPFCHWRHDQSSNDAIRARCSSRSVKKNAVASNNSAQTVWSTLSCLYVEVKCVCTIAMPRTSQSVSALGPVVGTKNQAR